VHILVSQYVALFGNYGKHSSLSILSKIDAHKQYNHVYCNEIHLWASTQFGATKRAVKKAGGRNCRMTDVLKF